MTRGLEAEVQRRAERLLQDIEQERDWVVSVLVAAMAEIDRVVEEVTDAAELERWRRVGRLVGAPVSRLSSGAGPGLRPRELEVLALVARGWSYAEVGVRLGLTPGTVKSYMRDLLPKLGAHSRHEAVARAQARGLLPPLSPGTDPRLRPTAS